MFKKEYLNNGIPVVMESFKNVRSVAIGIWVKVGSRHETSERNGISHFLEHMFFKGTKKRTVREIAFDIDSMGGDLNAFTSRENTAFYVKVIEEYLENGVELLTDIFVNSIFPEDEIEKEKKIIKEEIKMVEDTPDDYIYDLFQKTVWGREGLGQTILGTRETIASFTRSDLIKHIRTYYGTKDIVIACAGFFSQDKLMTMLNRKLGGLRQGTEPKTGTSSAFTQDIKVFPKKLSEAHICIGVPSLSQDDKERYTLFVLNTILGAGVSSRLFQEIREKRGLAYSVYSFTSSYTDTGLWGVYAGVSKKKVRETAELIISEMLNLSKTLSDPELERAKNHLKGSMILGLESTSSRMNNIARQEIYFNKYSSPDEIMKAVDMVSIGQIKELANRLISNDKFAITAYGDMPENVLEGVV